jgi:serine protease Do
LAEQLGYEDQAGVLVTDVAPGSPADNAGLEPRDLILEVGKKPVASAEACDQALREAGDKALIRLRKTTGAILYVTITKE